MQKAQFSAKNSLHGLLKLLNALIFNELYIEEYE